MRIVIGQYLSSGMQIINNISDVCDNRADSMVQPPPVTLDLSMLNGNLGKGDHNNGKNCWSIPDCNNFRVRSKRFLIDRSKASLSDCILCYTYQM